MNTSLLAGLGAGTGLVLASAIGASLLFPLAPSAPPQAVEQAQDMTPEPVPETLPEAVPQAEPEPEPEPEIASDIAADQSDDSAAPAQPPKPAPEPAPEMPPDAAPAPTGADVSEALVSEPELPDAVDPPEAEPAPDPVRQTTVTVPEAPQEQGALGDEQSPQTPGEQDQAQMTRLPSAVRPGPRGDGARPLPQVGLPLPTAPASEEPGAPDSAETAADPAASVAQQDGQTMPGIRAAALPQLGASAEMPQASADIPPASALTVSALERNSLYDGDTGTAPRMALVLGDPGLPTPMRRALAALDIQMTVALNPLDPSAQEAAEIYRASGKEVLILSTSLPEGATASDMDVSFNAFFAALPQAVGVIDLPENGFARNTRMLGDVLPLLAQDGHGLVTFSGGLTSAERAAQAAGVPHAEVFRVLDSGTESPFTIRRFLDRAVFQASQMGKVIVFGDASNDATMEALDMWLSEGRADQVALVPISGILLRDD